MGQMMSNLENPNITGPKANQAAWGDMDASEKGARVLAQGTRGLAQGFNNYQNQNSQMRQGSGGGMGPIPVAQPPDLSYLMPSTNQNAARRPGMLPSGNNVNFYGGS